MDMRIGVAIRLRRDLEQLEGGGTVRRRRASISPQVDGVEWSCIETISGCEFSVADDLEAVGFRVFAPFGVRVIHRMRKRGSDKRIRVERDYPVIPRYVFVGQPAGLLVAKRSHARIVSILPPSASLAPTIQAFGALQQSGRWDERIKHDWRQTAGLPCGSTVRITEGPFANLQAIVEDLPKPLRVVVSVSLFGRASRVELETGQVELV